VETFFDRNLGDLIHARAGVPGPVGKGESRTANVHVGEKSDKVILPMKQPNKGNKNPAEVVEGRTLVKGNSVETTAVRTQSRVAASSGLDAVRKVARGDKEAKFTALLHHITVDVLRRSYCNLKREAAAGIDGVTWQVYGEGLESRLHELHERIQRGSYRARPARRVTIPKPDGTQRPLSIWCLEDKIVQQAVVYVLEAIFETDFLGFSYGFRPGRGQHDALDALAVGLYRRKVNWVLDADIRRFFDTMNHDWMLKFLRHRIQDKRILRLICKWLKIGVMDKGRQTCAQRGAPQGAVVSPVLANIYLHYVFDLWANAWRDKVATGDMVVIRYADDSVVGFQHKADADRFLAMLQVRMCKFDLALHPDKTQLIRFGRSAVAHCRARGEGNPATFDFLGFTHYCTTSRKGGWFVIGRKTVKKRMRAQLRGIKDELRKRLHAPVAEVGVWLNRVLRGHLNYYAVPGNGQSLNAFVYQVGRLWIRALRRRSQRSRMTWERFARLRDTFFPPVRILHPWPFKRFDART
jgi:RNA-directed DNA polymerase